MDVKNSPKENQNLFLRNCSIPSPNTNKTSPSLVPSIKKDNNKHKENFFSFSNK